jgi:hypothetical protein
MSKDRLQDHVAEEVRALAVQAMALKQAVRNIKDRIESLSAVLERASTLGSLNLYCKFCGASIRPYDPHYYHQQEPVCDGCWDERLRPTS